ncbi:MAG: 4Fe-4S dicluster domain-containing protein [Candidatus Bathyarchaeia archaeon]|jgi:NAD-dependent dihydropyrimidine dehydrogenase PreA subunit
MVTEIKIDYDKCTACKKCIKACSFGVLEWLEDQPIIINAGNCSGCLDCKSICPVNAISVKEK